MLPPRNMRTPVFEERPLDIFSASPEYRAALPLGLPSRPARTQALHLATNGDVLIGHADNGVVLSLSSSCVLDSRSALVCLCSAVSSCWYLC